MSQPSALPRCSRSVSPRRSRAGRAARAGLGESALGGPAQDAQVTAAHLAGNHRRGRVDRVWRGRAGATGFTDRIGESEQVVGGRLRFGVLGRESDHLPATGGGEAGGVLTTQVVGVRLGVRRQGAQNGRAVRVDVRQGGDRRTAARRLGAPAGQVHSSDSRWLHGRRAAGTPHAARAAPSHLTRTRSEGDPGSSASSRSRRRSEWTRNRPGSCRSSRSRRRSEWTRASTGQLPEHPIPAPQRMDPVSIAQLDEDRIPGVAQVRRVITGQAP